MPLKTYRCVFVHVLWFWKTFFFTMQHLWNQGVSFSHHLPCGTCYCIVKAQEPSGSGLCGEHPRATVELCHRQACIPCALGAWSVVEYKKVQIPVPGDCKGIHKNPALNRTKLQEYHTQLVSLSFLLMWAKEWSLNRHKRTNAISFK